MPNPKFKTNFALTDQLKENQKKILTPRNNKDYYDYLTGILLFIRFSIRPYPTGFSREFCICIIKNIIEQNISDIWLIIHSCGFYCQGCFGPCILYFIVSGMIENYQTVIYHCIGKGKVSCFKYIAVGYFNPYHNAVMVLSHRYGIICRSLSIPDFVGSIFKNSA